MKMRERLLRGFGYLTLDPSPRLRRMRESLQNSPETAADGSRFCAYPGQALPPVPDSAYAPGSVPLDPAGWPHGEAGEDAP
jgi:hypothetical protein